MDQRRRVMMPWVFVVLLLMLLAVTMENAGQPASPQEISFQKRVQIFTIWQTWYCFRRQNHNTGSENRVSKEVRQQQSEKMRSLTHVPRTCGSLVARYAWCMRTA
jgi:cytochrome c-type biogenesis protein CcmH/NrfF